MKSRHHLLRNARTASALLLTVLTLTFSVQAQFQYVTNNGAITITGYHGSGGVVGIPTNINGLPVTTIQDLAFSGKQKITSITISNGITSIGNFAFNGCFNLTNASIPASVTNIGEGPFSACSSLAEISLDPLNPDFSVVAGVLFDKSQANLLECPAGLKAAGYTIPSTVTSIAGSAFFFCLTLTNVTIPGTVTSIGDGAFNTCAGLTNVVIPGSVTNLGSGAFGQCYNLASVTLTNGLTSIGSSAFESCAKLSAVVIPDTVASIGDNAFANCSGLSSAIIPAGSIGNFAFSQCVALTILSLGSGVTNIGNYAFGDCALTNISLSANVTSLGSIPFEVCPGMVAINVDPLNPNFSSADGVLFNKNQTTLLEFPINRAGTYAITNTVTDIADGAFEGCNGLTAVTLPNRLTDIGNSSFANCHGLGNLSIPVTVTNIGTNAFSSDSGLTNITLNSGLVRICDSAFSFSGLTAITIPASVTSIGPEVFGGCSSLTAITVDAANPAFSSLGGVLFDKGRTTLLQFPDALTGKYGIPDTVTSIGGFAFSDAIGLTGVTAPSGVTNVGTNAFFGCYGLQSVCFTGNAPPTNSSVFAYDTLATVYYLPGTTGWGATFDGRPTALWNPQVQTGNTAFGVRTNQFGFTIAGTSNLVLVVEAATNLVNPVWVPVATNTLTGGASYFSDPQWTNSPARFYRLRSP